MPYNIDDLNLKITPGRWSRTTANAGIYTLRRDKNKLDKIITANKTFYDPERSTPIKEWQANARLIVVAPRLFSILRLMINQYQQRGKINEYIIKQAVEVLIDATHD